MQTNYLIPYENAFMEANLVGPPWLPHPGRPDSARMLWGLLLPRECCYTNLHRPANPCGAMQLGSSPAAFATAEAARVALSEASARAAFSDAPWISKRAYLDDAQLWEDHGTSPLQPCRTFVSSVQLAELVP